MPAKKSRRIVIRWVVMLLLLAGVIWLQQSPAVIEQYYSRGIYPFVSRTLRILFGWLPFSLGDIVVALFLFYCAIRVFRFAGRLIKKKLDAAAVLPSILRGAQLLLSVYLLFMFLWGFNYYRKGTSKLLDIKPEAYTTQDVEVLNDHLLKRLQQIASDSAMIRQLQTNKREMLVGEALQGFSLMQNQLHTGPFGAVSFKPHLIGRLQSYMGYSGYYFPLTGEAHANLYAPTASLPFTVAHEMAHQAGFALESEANMVAYLVNKDSKNKFVQYSNYYVVYQYAFSNYWQVDSVAARQASKLWPPMVIADKQEAIAFSKAHESFFQPVLDSYYQWYLQQNNQPEGLASYNKVVALLIAYAKRYGWDAL